MNHASTHMYWERGKLSKMKLPKSQRLCKFLLTYRLTKSLRFGKSNSTIKSVIYPAHSIGIQNQKKSPFLRFCMLFLVPVFLLSCSGSKILTKKEKKSLHKLVSASPIFSKSYTGFALFDPLAKEILYEFDADKYFTPASNTKLFALYTALNLLGETIPAFEYGIKGDSLIFYGTGDPSLLHPFFIENDTLIQFLKSRPEQLFYCPDNFQDERYGAGWAWDDYLYYYQVEKSAMPIYGNVVTIKKGANTLVDTITPTHFQQYVQRNTGIERSRPRFKRALSTNQINLEGVFSKQKKFHQEVPFKYSDSLLVALLQMEIGKEIALLTNPPIMELERIYSGSTDSLYRRMMVESDNFVAEQLLLMCANELFDTMNTRRIITYAKDSLLQDLPDPLRWVDGSGLSRYNLFTPRSIVRVLEKIQEHLSIEEIQSIFAAGGESGTLTNYYRSKGNPFIYAKTGTLSNRHCLSGYLFTKSGKVLIFSFMHNNYYGSSTPLKKEMDKVLRTLHEEH